MANTPYLEAVKKRINNLGTNLKGDDIRLILIDLRQHLDFLDLKDKYRELMFYCNLTLHTELSFGIVQEFLKKIAELTSPESKEDINKRIPEILSVPHFRLQVINILQNAGIPTFLFDNQGNWKEYFNGLLPFLIEKPLHYLKPKPKKNYLPNFLKWIIQKPKKTTNQEEVYVKSFVLIEAKNLSADHPDRKDPNFRPSMCYWRMTLMPFNETFEGPLYRPEDRSAFKS